MTSVGSGLRRRTCFLVQKRKFCTDIPYMKFAPDFGLEFDWSLYRIKIALTF
ncbi:118_t:CDS:2 [Gigaspora margarita]|uniref:118_t:CDS:1 n=1 Tax=Gigaspora margarita TaxID=4874 RepID=A0ABN7W402_GIGMA|nr:118_t:CDS:2 [Gigaspora margarita]